MNQHEVRQILEVIQFRDWQFHVGAEDERMYLQVRFTAPCSKVGEVTNWSGRKWWLSQFMVRSEIVQTALKAVLMATEHEAREDFRYRGRAIFGPHFDVDRLWDMATPTAEETRKPPQGPTVNAEIHHG